MNTYVFSSNLRCLYTCLPANFSSLHIAMQLHGVCWGQVCLRVSAEELGLTPAVERRFQGVLGCSNPKPFCLCSVQGAPSASSIQGFSLWVRLQGSVICMVCRSGTNGLSHFPPALKLPTMEQKQKKLQRNLRIGTPDTVGIRLQRCDHEVFSPNASQSYRDDKQE